MATSSAPPVQQGYSQAPVPPYQGYPQQGHDVREQQRFETQFERERRLNDEAYRRMEEHRRMEERR